MLNLKTFQKLNALKGAFLAFRKATWLDAKGGLVETIHKFREAKSQPR
jgi:hypothetical protein